MGGLQEKELRRVFEMISGVKKKNHLKQTINRIRNQVAEARAKESELADVRLTVNKKKVEEEDAVVQRRIDALLQELHELETDPERKISVGDIMEITKCLHQPMSKKEAQELVWEVRKFSVICCILCS
jgi:anaerobic ribonucleoside-triphosphate reductase